MFDETKRAVEMAEGVGWTESGGRVVVDPGIEVKVSEEDDDDDEVEE